MRAFVLFTLLVAPSAFASSIFLPGTQTSKLTLAANDEPVSGFVPAPMPPPAPAETNFAALSVRLIDHQIQTLEFMKSSLAGPVTTLVIGGSALIAGLVLMPFGYGALVVGVMMMAGAALPLAIGLVWLFSNLGHNNAINVAIKKLRQDRASLGGAPTAFQLPTSEPELFQLASF